MDFIREVFKPETVTAIIFSLLGSLSTVSGQFFIHRLKAKSEARREALSMHFNETRSALKQSIVLMNRLYKAYDPEDETDYKYLERIFNSIYVDKLENELCLIPDEISDRITKLYYTIKIPYNEYSHESYFDQDRANIDSLFDTINFIKVAAKKALADMAR